MKEINKVIGDEPVILVDDSEVIKSYGKILESLSYEKGYASTKNEKQPISVYSHIHSSHDKNYKSTNEETSK